MSVSDNVEPSCTGCGAVAGEDGLCDYCRDRRSCKTCRHWQADDPKAHRGQWGLCARGYSDSCEPTDETTLAFARPTPEQSTEAELRTWSAFGCVMHEPKT